MKSLQRQGAAVLVKQSSAEFKFVLLIFAGILASQDLPCFEVLVGNSLSDAVAWKCASHQATAAAVASIEPLHA